MTFLSSEKKAFLVSIESVPCNHIISGNGFASTGQTNVTESPSITSKFRLPSEANSGGAKI